MLNDIRKHLKQDLDKKRYEHTLSVSYTCTALAMRYEYDLKKAEMAGLLHDCAKCIPAETMFKQCQKHNISLSDIEMNNSELIHAKLGAFLSMNEYGINDKEIISAILVHTTGKPDMTLLEKILFVADYIEPRRYKAKNLTAIRKQAFIDIDVAVYMILSDTIAYLNETSVQIDEHSIKALEFYSKLYGNNVEIN